MIDDKMLAELKRLHDGMTKAPWFYNSYSTVFCGDSEVINAENAFEDELAAKGELDDPKHKARWYELESIVCWVPAISGDQAHGRRATDAQGIACFRNAIPVLIAEIERLRAAGDCHICHHKWPSLQFCSRCGPSCEKCELATLRAENARLLKLTADKEHDSEASE